MIRNNLSLIYAAVYLLPYWYHLWLWTKRIHFLNPLKCTLKQIFERRPGWFGALCLLTEFVKNQPHSSGTRRKHRVSLRRAVRRGPSAKPIMDWPLGSPVPRDFLTRKTNTQEQTRPGLNIWFDTLCVTSSLQTVKSNNFTHDTERRISSDSISTFTLREYGLSAV